MNPEQKGIADYGAYLPEELRNKLDRFINRPGTQIMYVGDLARHSLEDLAKAGFTHPR